MVHREKAIQIALDAHAGQQDKAGDPYILHPLRLMLQMDSDIEMTTAVLHDVIEDSDMTVEGLRKEGFPEEVLTALEYLTRKQNQTYREFISEIKNHPLAKKVKMADLQDNMNITRLHTLTDRDSERLKKYHDAWQTLKNP